MIYTVPMAAPVTVLHIICIHVVGGGKADPSISS